MWRFEAGMYWFLHTKVPTADGCFCGSVGKEDRFIFLRNAVDVVGNSIEGLPDAGSSGNGGILVGQSRH
jgi:hypothetical protein